MQSKQTWNTNASLKQPPVTLQETMQVHAWYSEVIVELYHTLTEHTLLTKYSNKTITSTVQISEGLDYLSLSIHCTILSLVQINT